MEIRKFELGDENEVSRVIAKDLRRENIKDYPKERIERLVATLTPEFILKRASWCHAYVATDENKVIGIGMIGPYWGSETEASFFTIFIDPDYKGQGIGKKIVQTLENDEYYKRSNRVEIPASISAVEFYRHFGYNFKLRDNIKGNIVDDEWEYRLEKYPNQTIPFDRTIFNLRPYIDNEYHDYKEFIYDLKKDLYMKYVEENYGKWDEEVQRELFKKFITANEDDMKIIELNGETIGFYHGRSDGDTYEIGNICIKREFQGKGIGTTLLKEMIDLNKDKDITLQVFKQNKAIELYKRLGFKVYDSDSCHYKLVLKRKEDNKDEKRIY